MPSTPALIADRLPLLGVESLCLRAYGGNSRKERRRTRNEPGLQPCCPEIMLVYKLIYTYVLFCSGLSNCKLRFSLGGLNGHPSQCHGIDLETVFPIVQRCREIRSGASTKQTSTIKLGRRSWEGSEKGHMFFH